MEERIARLEDKVDRLHIDVVETNTQISRLEQKIDALMTTSAAPRVRRREGPPLERAKMRDIVNAAQRAMVLALGRDQWADWAWRLVAGGALLGAAAYLSRLAENAA